MLDYLKEFMCGLKIEAIAGIYFFVCLVILWTFGCTVLPISMLVVAFLAFEAFYLHATAK